jgi:5'-nucleotidase
MAQKPLPRAAILNVNVPNVPYQDLKGTQVTRMGRRYQSEPAIKDTDPRGKPIYWIGPSGKAKDSGPGTDFHAVEHDYVSVTPIRIDLTHYDLFQPLSQWVADL